MVRAAVASLLPASATRPAWPRRVFPVGTHIMGCVNAAGRVFPRRNDGGERVFLLSSRADPSAHGRPFGHRGAPGLSRIVWPRAGYSPSHPPMGRPARASMPWRGVSFLCLACGTHIVRCRARQRRLPGSCKPFPAGTMAGEPGSQLPGRDPASAPRHPVRRAGRIPVVERVNAAPVRPVIPVRGTMAGQVVTPMCRFPSARRHPDAYVRTPSLGRPADRASASGAEGRGFESHPRHEAGVRCCSDSFPPISPGLRRCSHNGQCGGFPSRRRGSDSRTPLRRPHRAFSRR